MESELWKAALDTLTAPDRKYYEIYFSNQGYQTSDLDSFIKVQLQDWKAKSSAVRVGSKKIIVRDVVERIASWLGKFMEVGTIAMSYDPVHAALPWAAVRFILEVALSDVHAHVSVISLVEKISSLLTRSRIIIPLYLGSTQGDTLLPLRDSIIKLFAKILLVLLNLLDHFDRPTHVRLLRNIVTRPVEKCKEYTKALEERDAEVERLCGSVDSNATLDSASRVQEIESNTQCTKEIVLRLEEMVRQINAPYIRLSQQVETVYNDLLQNKTRRIGKWLSRSQYTEHHNYVRRNRSKHSCHWILEKPEFKEWNSQSESSLLWLRGSPGSGKTFLTSKVIDELLRGGQEKGPSAPVAYFYCSRDAAAPDRGSPANVLRAIIKQVARVRENFPVVKPVYECYQRLLDEGVDRELDLNESIELLLELVNEAPATIIIDGLDECSTQGVTRGDLLKGLQEIVESSENIVKIFVSSRDEPDIRAALQFHPNLMIDAHDNAADIRIFIEVELNKEIDARSQRGDDELSEELQKRIKETLVDGADGIFRWVSLQLIALFDTNVNKLPEDIEEQLPKLPRGLKASYDVIYEQVQRQGAASQKIAFRAIAWLLCAREKLSTWDFIDALNIGSPGRPSVRSIEKVTDICGNFVKHDAELDQFRIFHLSVTNYFEEDKKEEWSPSVLHRIVAEMCIEKLLANQLFSPPRVTTNSDNKTFGDYANVYWPWHCTKANKDQRLGNLHCSLEQDLHKLLLGGQMTAQHFEAWDQLCGISIREIGLNRAGHACDNLYSKLHDSFNKIDTTPRSRTLVACAFGFSDIVKSMLERNDNFNVRSRTGLQPLYIAIRHGQDKVRELLIPEIRHDFSIYVRSIHLEAVVRTGNDEFVEWLLRSSQPNLVTYEMLSGAAEFCHPKTFRYLHTEFDSPIAQNVVVSELLLVAAARNESYGEAMVKEILPRTNTILDDAYLAAARNPVDGDIILKLLLDRHTPKHLERSLIEISTWKNYNGNQTLRLVLKYYPHWIPDEGLIIYATENEDIRILEMVLEVCPTFTITQSTLKAAASNPKCGKEMVEMLVKSSNSDYFDFIDIDGIITAAAGNKKFGKQIVDFLLEHFNSPSPQVLARITNMRSVDVSIIEKLLQLLQGTTLPEAIFINAAHNETSGKLIKLLRKTSNEEFIKCGDSVILAMSSNAYIDSNVLNECLIDLTPDLHIVSIALRNAAGLPQSDTFRVLLNYYDSNTALTGILEEVVDNTSCGFGLVQLLFKKFPDLPVSEHAMELAASNGGQGRDLFDFLLSRVTHIKLPVSALVAASVNQDLGNLILPLALTRFDGPTLVDDLAASCALNRVYGFELLDSIFKHNHVSWSSQPNLVGVFCETATHVGNFHLLHEVLRLNSDPVFDLHIFGFSPPKITDSDLLDGLVRYCDSDVLIYNTAYRLAEGSGGEAESDLEMMQRILDLPRANEIVKEIYISAARRIAGSFQMLHLLRSKRPDGYTGMKLLPRPTNLETYLTLFHAARGVGYDEKELLKAARTPMIGFPIVRMLLMNKSDMKVTEDMLKAAAEPLADLSTFQLLWARQSDFHVTMNILEIATKSNHRNGLELLRFLWSKEENLQISEELLKTALNNEFRSLELLRFFWSKNPHLHITDEMLALAAGNRFIATELIQFFWSKKTDIQITEEMLEAGSRNNGVGVEILQLFWIRKPDITITEKMVEAATKNTGCGLDILQLFWSKKSDILITEKALEGAVTNMPVLRFLFCKMNDLEVGEDAVKVAFRGSGQDIVRFLWSQSNVQITENILQAAAAEPNDSVEILQFLWSQGHFPITENLVKTAARNVLTALEALRFLWNKRPFYITEGVVKSAASNFNQGLQVLQFLWSKGPFQITESVLKGSIQHNSQAVAVLQYLWSKNKFPVTESLVEAAASNIHNTSIETLHFLWSKSHFQITEKILRSAAGNPARGAQVLQFLIEKGRLLTSSQTEENPDRAEDLAQVVPLDKLSNLQNTALLFNAVRNGFRQCCLNMLVRKVDVNFVNYFGETPLAVAAKYGHKTVVELLLAHDADLTIKDELGRTAIQWAVKYGHHSVAQILQNAASPDTKTAPLV